MGIGDLGKNGVGLINLLTNSRVASGQTQTSEPDLPNREEEVGRWFLCPLYVPVCKSCSRTVCTTDDTRASVGRVERASCRPTSTACICYLLALVWVSFGPVAGNREENAAAQILERDGLLLASLGADRCVRERFFFPARALGVDAPP